MLSKIAMLTMAVCAVCAAADDDWAKLSAVKSGTEVRITRKGKPQPVVGKMDEARDQSLVVVVKNEQIAIPKEEIEKVEARPNKGGGKFEKTETVTRDPGYQAPDSPNRPQRTQGPGGSSSSGVTYSSSKPDFEVVYRRRNP